MSASVFDADTGDEPYLEWLENNPKGFVLNTRRSQGSSYWWLHRSSCHHITEPKEDGAYTSGDYIKVCSNNSEDLREWWRAENRPKLKEYKSCKNCRPADLADLAPPPAEEVGTTGTYIEGATCEVTTNAYERNPRAREACLKEHGCSCVICGFNFENVYGVVAKGFIHVHHLVPLSEIGKAYEVDPIKDLRPVCPNCHAVIHIGGNQSGIEEVRNLLADRQQAQIKSV